MNWQDILKYMNKGNTIDSKFFTRVLNTADLGQALVAMSNTKGGIIFIGIDVKNYHLVGTTIDRDWVNEHIMPKCHPKPELDMSFFQKNDKVIAIIKIVQNYEKPYYYDNRCYVMETDKTQYTLIEKTPVDEIGDDSESDVVSSHVNTEDISKITDDLIDLNEDSHGIDQVDVDDISISKLTGGVCAQDTKTDLVAHQLPDENFSIDSNSDASLNERQKNALKFIKREKTIKNKQYRLLFNVSHKTAHLELVDMVSKQFIQSQGSGRSTCYILSATFQQSLI